MSEKLKPEEDVDKDGIRDGSPEAIGKLGQDIVNIFDGFFQGLADGFSKYKSTPKKEVKEEDEDKGPQVLNEDK